jgi:hydroxypyruvate reductase
MMNDTAARILQLALLPVPEDYCVPEDLPIAVRTDPASTLEWLGRHGSNVEAIITHSGHGVPEFVWQHVPNLQLIANLGAGLERIDLPLAASRGVRVTTTADLIADDVADIAMAFALSLIRQLPAFEDFIRSGRWRGEEPGLTHSVKGRRLGIFGLGRIGLAISKRAAPFGFILGYHNRLARSDVAAQYFPTLLGLAQWAEVLIVSVPGGPATAHAINAEVLSALGAEGIIINVGRGSTIDQSALLAVLASKQIAGIGLDVFENEPQVDAAFLEAANVLVSPHLASSTFESCIAMADAVYREARSVSRV